MRVLALRVDPLAMLGATTVRDQQRVRGNGGLGEKAEHAQASRELSQQHLAPNSGVSKNSSFHGRSLLTIEEA